MSDEPLSSAAAAASVIDGNGGGTTNDSRDHRWQNCPCQNWTQEKILQAPRSEVCTDRLLAWLSGAGGEGGGTYDEASSQQLRGEEEVRLTCHEGGRGRCVNRVNASFVILNGLRDGCRTYLDSSTSSSTATTLEVSIGGSAASSGDGGGARHKEQQKPKPPSYEESFPPLGSPSATAATSSPNVLVGRKKHVSKQYPPARQKDRGHDGNAHANSTSKNKAGTTKSKKRRIRPSAASAVPAPSSSAASGGVWSTTKVVGNIASLPSMDTTDMIRSFPGASSHKVATGRNKVKGGDVAGEARRKKGHQQQASVKKANAPAAAAAVETPAVLRGVADKAEKKKTVVNPAPGSPKGGKKPLPPVAVPNGQIQAAPVVPETTRVKECSPPIISEECQGGQITKEDEATLTLQRMRLVTIYAAIIRNNLVPSTALELHLLLRLLSVASYDSSSTSTSLNGKNGNSLGAEKRSNAAEQKSSVAQVTSFEYLFRTTSTCGHFATQVLRELKSIVFNLGHEMIKDLCGCPLLDEFVPDIVDELRSVVDRGDHQHVFETDLHDTVTIAGNGTARMYSLPFDHDRDSRHNYRTAEQSRTYTNREECRDAFLYQVRRFQNIRGKLLDPAEVARYANGLRLEARKVLQKLFSCNLSWFAQLFCDLLLQIGMVAVEETDKEVLKRVADKKRLQKLHQRLSTKGSQLSKSSQKLVLENQDQPGSTSGLLPEHLFPGNQEFFYLFVVSADSYSFGTHLRHRLLGGVARLMDVQEARGTMPRLLKLKLLGKFLGLMLFSPNWDLTGQDYFGGFNGGSSASTTDAITDLDCSRPPLPLREYIEKAWQDGRLVAVIPWVVDFFWMIKWDMVSQRSSYYAGVLGLLRAIQREIGPSGCEAYTNYNSNCQLMKLGLESLFGEVIGLGKTERLPFVVLAERTVTARNLYPTTKDMDGQMVIKSDVRLDYAPLWFSSVFLFSFCSHLEELHKLLFELKSNGRRGAGGGGVSKKMRPYAVSNELISVFSQLGVASFPASSSTAQDKGGTGVKDKLVDSFFHQHPELRKVAEFVVDISVKNVCSLLLAEIISPTVERQLSANRKFLGASSPSSPTFNMEVYLRVLRDIEEELKRAACALLRETCESSLVDAMRSLVAATVPVPVRETAISLSAVHALCEGKRLTGALIRVEVKKRFDSSLSKAKKAGQDMDDDNVEGQIFFSQKAALDSWVHKLEDITALLKEQLHADGSDFNSKTDDEDHKRQRVTCQKCREAVQILTLSEREEGNEAVPVVEQFGRILASLLTQWFSRTLGDGEIRYKKEPSCMSEAVSLAVALAGRGLAGPELCAVGSLLRKNLAVYLQWNEIDCALPAEVTDSTPSELERGNDGTEKKAELLLSLLNGNLMTAPDLESSFLQLLSLGDGRIESVGWSLIHRMDRDRVTSTHTEVFSMNKLRQVLEGQRDQTTNGTAAT